MKILPVFKTSFKSVSYSFKNFSMLFKVAMPWVLIYVLFTLVFQLLGIDDYYELERSVDYVSRFPTEAIKNGYGNLSQLQFEFETLQAQLGIAASLHYWLDKFMLAICYSAVGVVWYRGFLLSEKPPKIRFATLEFKFLIYLILYMVILWALFLVLTNLMLELNVAATGTIGFASMILGIFMVLFAVRFLLVFAGVSVGDKRMSPILSWRVTAGNSWRLYGGTLLILAMSIPIFIVKAIVGVWAMPIFINWPIQAFLTMLSGVFLFSFTALCYQFFVPPPKDGDLD